MDELTRLYGGAEVTEWRVALTKRIQEHVKENLAKSGASSTGGKSTGGKSTGGKSTGIKSATPPLTTGAANEEGREITYDKRGRPLGGHRTLCSYA